MRSSFIFKLREVVDATDPSLSWGATGDSFKVADSATFSTSALSGYFHCSSFSAFLRQLHLHGFRRKVDDGNTWEFAHASFVKGKPALMSKIKCRLAGSHTAPHKLRALRIMASVPRHASRAPHHRRTAASSRRRRHHRRPASELPPLSPPPSLSPLAFVSRSTVAAVSVGGRAGAKGRGSALEGVTLALKTATEAATRGDNVRGRHAGLEGG